MFNNRWNWLFIMVLVVCLAIPLGCAKREREPKKVSKEQISDFEQAMKEIKEAGVALNFKDFSNYTDKEKVLFDPESLADPDKQKKIDRAIRLLCKVLNITDVENISTIYNTSISSGNIMTSNTTGSGLTKEDSAYCYLELGRLYTLRAVSIIAYMSKKSSESDFDVKLQDGRYKFIDEIGDNIDSTYDCVKLTQDKITCLANVIYILSGLEVKISEDAKNTWETNYKTSINLSPEEEIKQVYKPFVFDHNKYGVCKGGIALFFKAVSLCGEILSNDIKTSLDEVAGFVMDLKTTMNTEMKDWGLRIE
ncbi:MAG: hypothetical protein QMD92_07145 [bacterium]|nr:hypothetical protein [bacterium]